jgi:hypothetical protein
MKTLIRLFIKRNYIEKAINFEFTKNHSSNVVLFYYSDTSKNLTILKKCLSLYKYTNEELDNYIEVLTKKLTSHIEWKENNRKRLSQAGLGNWARKKRDLEDMLKELKSGVKNN